MSARTRRGTRRWWKSSTIRPRCPTRSSWPCSGRTTTRPSGTGRARTGLDAFFQKPEPAYHWEQERGGAGSGEQEVDGVKIYSLHLVSQVWQGITWEHRIQIFRPEKLAHPEFCTLYNTGGSGSESN